MTQPDQDPKSSPRPDAAPAGKQEPDLVLDCLGMLCPLPIIELGKAAARHESGRRIALLSDDPAAAADVAAWCRMGGHTLVSSTPIEGTPTNPSPASTPMSYLVKLG